MFSPLYSVSGNVPQRRIPPLPTRPGAVGPVLGSQAAEGFRSYQSFSTMSFRQTQ